MTNYHCKGGDDQYNIVQLHNNFETSLILSLTNQWPCGAICGNLSKRILNKLILSGVIGKFIFSSKIQLKFSIIHYGFIGLITQGSPFSPVGPYTRKRDLRNSRHFRQLTSAGSRGFWPEKGRNYQKYYTTSFI